MIRAIPHNAAWFAKQEARLQEPIKNTVRYHTRRETLKLLSFAVPVAGLYFGGKALHNLLSIRKYILNFSNLSTDIMNRGRSITNDGAPGCGKTFTGSNLAYFLAREQWEKLKNDYFTQRTMVSQWLRNGETDKLNRFKKLEESYLFYAEREHKYIPCLVSSVPLREYGTGRMSYVLTPELFLQIERTPERTVFFYDESGLSQGSNTSGYEPKELLEFWRFCRQFFNGIFVCTNQDGGQNAISMRRSTDYVNHIYGQEWIFEPVALKAKYEKKKAKYFKRLRKGRLSEKQIEYIGQELYYLDKYIATIGFRRVTSRLTTPAGAPVGAEEYYIMPAIGIVEYDDRAYSELYKCKDKPITLKGWERLVIDEYDDTAYRQNNTVGDGAKKNNARRRVA